MQFHFLLMNVNFAKIRIYFLYLSGVLNHYINMNEIDFIYNKPIITKHKTKDEVYVIDLCDEILGIKASRQHCFDFLRGDSLNGKRGKKLCVDAYYESKNLVIEYNEKQHTEDVAFFDRKKTISGVTRKVQRKIYDERRKILLPQHGINLVVISYSDFEYDKRKKIIRNKTNDLKVISEKIQMYV